MRSSRWTPGAICALVVTLAAPTLAQPSAPRSVRDCVDFTEREHGDDAVELTTENRCAVPVACTIEWRVVCAPDARARRSVHAGSEKLSLAEGARQSVLASAAVCGADSFTIDDITWGCKPSKD